MKRLFFVLWFVTAAVPALAEDKLVSHKAVYDIDLASTRGGAAGVVNAAGKMQYTLQKKCGQWQTESVFSLDVGYELSGTDTTNWKQLTKESANGCLFEFEVFVREKGQDRKDLSGKAVCENGKKVLRLTQPVQSEASFPKNVLFPVQQTLRLIKAAEEGKKNVSSYVYDGTRPESLYSMHAAIAKADGFSSRHVKGDVGLIKNKKAYRLDTAFYEEFNLANPSDGTPLYEVSLYYYDNGISDGIVQDFGAYRLRSSLTELSRLPEIPCKTKKKRQPLTTP